MMAGITENFVLQNFIFRSNYFRIINNLVGLSKPTSDVNNLIKKFRPQLSIFLVEHMQLL